MGIGQNPGVHCTWVNLINPSSAAESRESRPKSIKRRIPHLFRFSAKPGEALISKLPFLGGWKGLRDVLVPKMLPATEPSISSLTTVCDRQFKILIKLSACPCNNDNYIKALDEHGRLRVWSGNFGASRNHNDSLSLDFRLQNTPFLQREVVNQLQELSDVIQAGM